MDQQKEAQNKKAVEQFKKFLERWTCAEELAEHLDGILWDYTKYVITDPHFGAGASAFDDLYYLKTLRDICLNKGETL